MVEAPAAGGGDIIAVIEEELEDIGDGPHIFSWDDPPLVEAFIFGERRNQNRGGVQRLADMEGRGRIQLEAEFGSGDCRPEDHWDPTENPQTREANVGVGDSSDEDWDTVEEEEVEDEDVGAEDGGSCSTVEDDVGQMYNIGLDIFSRDAYDRRKEIMPGWDLEREGEWLRMLDPPNTVTDEDTRLKEVQQEIVNILQDIQDLKDPIQEVKHLRDLKHQNPEVDVKAIVAAVRPPDLREAIILGMDYEEIKARDDPLSTPSMSSLTRFPRANMLVEACTQTDSSFDEIRMMSMWTFLSWMVTGMPGIVKIKGNNKEPSGGTPMSYRKRQ